MSGLSFLKGYYRHFVKVIKVDVTRSSDIDRVATTLAKNKLNVDVMINNAGYFMEKQERFNNE